MRAQLPLERSNLQVFFCRACQYTFINRDFIISHLLLRVSYPKKEGRREKERERLRIFIYEKIIDPFAIDEQYNNIHRSSIFSMDKEKSSQNDPKAQTGSSLEEREGPIVE